MSDIEYNIDYNSDFLKKLSKAVKNRKLTVNPKDYWNYLLKNKDFQDHPISSKSAGKYRRAYHVYLSTKVKEGEFIIE